MPDTSGKRGQIDGFDQDKVQFQANKDLANRSLTGSFIYLVLWFTIIIPNEFYRTAREECFWFSVSFIILAIARTIMIKKFEHIYGRSPNVWRWVFFPLVLSTALLWGALCAISTVNPTYSSISFAILISTAGLTGGGAVSVASNRLVTVCLITALLIPAGLTILLTHQTNDITVGLIFFIYWFGMLFVTKIQHSEYWKGLRNSFLIEQHAAKLELLNTLDGLTGLKNRAFFNQTLQMELKRASRTQSELSLLMIDIDHFKSVNDCHGHLAGDDCLKMLSEALSGISKRETDVVARFGGEEFAFILPGIDMENTLLFAEKIRCAVEELKLERPHGDISFTVSIGATNILPSFDTMDFMVVDAADKALYKAKDKGRNQVAYQSVSLQDECSGKLMSDAVG